MKKFPFKGARFVTGAVAEKGYPTFRADSGKLIPEVAVAGRSNVGKSSLLNHLFVHKGLVKTSSTPGKTQHINFFSIGKSWSFVDLPGYGYANVPRGVRRQWGPMVSEYLQNRSQLKVVLFLLDIRRIPNEEDKTFLEWAARAKKSVVMVLTKSDKVNQKDKRINTQRILDELDTENLHYVHYSVPKGRGRDELMGLIKEAMESELATEEEV